MTIAQLMPMFTLTASPPPGVPRGCAIAGLQWRFER